MDLIKIEKIDEDNMDSPNSDFFANASNASDLKKKKGPPPSSEELCLICGDRSSGFHYNARSCEGCKGFFRRSITKNSVYQCKYGGNCEIDMFMRRKCQQCRLKKCLQMGMKAECVVPEYQCAIKRSSKKQQKEKDKPNSTTDELSCSSNGSTKSMSNSLSNVQIDPITPQQSEAIKKLVYFQDRFESPSPADVAKITPFTLGGSEEDGLKRFQHITEMTILTVQLIVEFSKNVPGFGELTISILSMQNDFEERKLMNSVLHREDQITLLKACSSEVMMLRCSRKYDYQTDSIVYANNQPYTRENYRSASVGENCDQIFNFCKNMWLLKVDNAEYALLTVIVIFSERPNLHDPKKVEKIQEFYINTLRAYVDKNRAPGTYFARLLSILTELRTLGMINNQMCFSLKVKNKRLPPFLIEIWDINST